MGRKLTLGGILAVGVAAVASLGIGSWNDGASAAPDKAAGKAPNAWGFNLTAIDGSPMPMSQYKGKVVLLVNTASFCGLTPQYEGLQALQTKYAAKGFTVIGVPSGNFMGQEHKTNKEISTFCQTKFGIKFPLAEKSNVVGDTRIPIYQWAAAKLGEDNTPKWNFHKYLIGRDGQLIRAFGSKTVPTDAGVTAAIEAALKAG